MTTKRLLFLLVTLSLATPTFAQLLAKPQITSISPNSGPSEGGMRVVITGQAFGLPPNFTCVAPCPPKVTFDTTDVVPSVYTDNTLVITTPSHAAGLVNVTVTTADNRASDAAPGFTYLDTTEARYEKVLLP
ncbi:MAG: hypothetical protein JWN02_702, partial [Acidobacteria bacterium]|nr:hypothetical protein [Acidobacteriota bacterium]